MANVYAYAGKGAGGIFCSTPMSFANCVAERVNGAESAS